jgi:hypothetical protein
VDVRCVAVAKEGTDSPEDAKEEVILYWGANVKQTKRNVTL